MDAPLGFHFYESFSTLTLRPQDISRVSGNLLGIGDGFPNISLVLMEHGYSAFSTSDGIFLLQNKLKIAQISFTFTSIFSSSLQIMEICPRANVVGLQPLKLPQLRNRIS